MARKSKPKEVTKVRLISKSCEMVHTEEPPFYKCSRCHKIISRGFHYKESNIGDIVLCQYCSDLCKSHLRNANSKDIDDFDRKVYDDAFNIDIASIEPNSIYTQISKLYKLVIEAVTQPYAPTRINYMLAKFEKTLVQLCREQSNSARTINYLKNLIKKTDYYYVKHRSASVISLKSKDKVRIDSLIKLKEILNTCENIADPDQVVDTITIEWTTIVFNTNSIKVTGKTANDVLHCSLNGAKPFYNHFSPIFSNLIPELRLELHSKRPPQVLNSEEFNEIFLYLDIQEQIANGNIEAYKNMFEHIRRAKLPIHQAILPKDKSIYMNYLAQRHNNAYRYIPVYENDHHRCDAFLYTITRKNECYIVWENISPNTATYIFRCKTDNYDTTLQKVYDYVSSDIAYKRMMLYRKDLKIDIEYHMILHSSFTQWKSDIENHIRL